MNRKTLISTAAAVAAASLLLSACGSDSSKGDKTAGGGGASGTIASKLILGGPAEFATRPDGVPGLKKIYGATFQSFKTLDTGGPVTVTSLKNGQVDAADLFTTDPAIGTFRGTLGNTTPLRCKKPKVKKHGKCVKKKKKSKSKKKNRKGRGNRR